MVSRNDRNGKHTITIFDVRRLDVVLALTTASIKYQQEATNLSRESKSNADAPNTNRGKLLEADTSSFMLLRLLIQRVSEATTSGSASLQ